MGRALGSVAAVLFAASAVLAGEATTGAGAASDPSWPQFHGPRRDNISPDKGLLKQWPESGPKLLWTCSEMGGGYAGVSIAEGKLFASGDFQEQEAVLALDPNGKVLWKVANGPSWKGPYPGARTTPTCHQGVLYHLGPTGRLAALKAKDGREIWAVDLKREFAAQHGQWAVAENVAVDGNMVLCVPGGAKGRIVALDKATGKPVWVNTEVAEIAAYASPVIVERGGVRQMITVMQKSIVSVEAATGKLLWTHPHETKNDQNVNMPLYSDGHIFAASGHSTGARLLKLAPDGRGVEQLWLAKDLDNCHGGVLLLDGRLYGSGCRLNNKGFVCVDYATGKTLWNDKALGKLSLAYADGMIYGLSDRGRMHLIEPGGDQCKVVSRFDLPKGPNLTLSHPVVFGGRLYVRHWNNLYAYDVRAAAGG